MLTFAAPAFLWALLALPLVVLLHRLRVRRRRREVAGLFLWRQAKDVGTSRPRFHAGLLLLLQLLAVTALALALARPQLQLTGPADRVIVIDASASMLALDGPVAPGEEDVDGGPVAAPGGLTGRTRFDEARARAAALAEGAGRVAIVRGGLQPRIVLPFTDDALEIARALDLLQAGDAGMDASRTLVLARDLAGLSGDGGEAAGGEAGEGAGATPDGAAPSGGNGAAGAEAGASAGEAAPAGAEVHWLSDTPPPSLAGVEVHPLAGGGSNVGITGFELIADQAWVRLSSGGGRPVEVPVQLLRGDTPVARTDLLVPARGDVSFTMPVGEGGGIVTARITPPEGDALAIDDVAFAGSPRTRVAVEGDFAALERALGAIPEVDTRVGAGRSNLPAAADLYVLTSADPAGETAELPSAPTVLLPPRDAPAVAAEVLDWVRTDPLLRFVDLRELTVALVEGPPFGEEEGWTTLIRGAPLAAQADEEAPPPDPVPLLQRMDRPSGPIWRFAFHPVRGDLTLRPAFPTLVVNLVDLVRGTARVRLGQALPAGATRDGEALDVALEPGSYDLEDGSLHASLLSEVETRLPGAAAFASAGGAPGASPASEAGAPPVGAATGDAPTPATRAVGPVETSEGPAAARTLVPWLLVLVLLLVALEWWGWTGWRGLRGSSAARRPGRG